MIQMKKKTWIEFKETGLLWWINMILHTFGWAIVLEVDKDTKKLLDVYPARVKYRGFPVLMTYQRMKVCQNIQKFVRLNRRQKKE